MKERVLPEAKCAGARSQILLILCVAIPAFCNLFSVSGQTQSPPPGPQMIGPVFKSTDAGATWAAINNGITCQSVLALAADPGSPGVLYAGTDRDVFKTTDGGAHWAPADGVIGLFSIRTVAIDPVNTSTVYAGGSAIGRSGALKSTDAGLTWKPIYAGLPNLEVSHSLVDPVTPSVLYVEATTGVFKSTDSGNQWSLALPLPLLGDVLAPRDLKLDPLNPAIVYAVGSGRIFKSINGGGDWVNITGQVIVPATILMDSLNPSIYVTTLENSIYKSIDGGTTWVLLATRDSFPGTGFYKLAIHPIIPTTLYALTLRGISKSIDGGITWINTGALPFQIFDLAFEPESPSTMYAGGSGGVGPTDTPRILWFNIVGKKLLISGGGFDDGAVLLLDGQEQTTKADKQRPTFTLIAKRAGKKIKKNPDLKIQVRNANGKLSQEVTIWPPLD